MENSKVNLSKLSQILVDECSRLEPAQAEVCADDANETKVVYENTDYSVASSSQSTVLGLRVIHKNRLGFITTNSLDPEDLKTRAKEALMVARLSPESPNHGIAPKQRVSGEFEMVDSKLSNATTKDLMQWADLLVSESRKDDRVSLDRAEVTMQTQTRIIQNSNGVLQKMSQTTCSWYVMGMAREKEEVTSFDYDGDTSKSYAEVEAKIKKTAQTFRESVIGSLGARSAESYKGAVLFHPSAVAALLASVIGFNVNARGQQDGMSKWAKLLGQKVASPLFTMAEDPLDETRPGDWSPFDREGVLTSKHEIIKDGVLNFTAHNMFTAKRAGTEPTGNAVGGSRGVPSIGLHALSIKPGKTSLNEMYGSLNKGLVLKRFSGNSDPVSGQFSGIAKNSWWVENGKTAYPLKEVMISGNMFELLDQIKLVGSEIFRQSGSFDSPYILIDGVSVTSG